jgi:hypothetical protein
MRLARHARDDNWLDSNPSELPPVLSGVLEYERTASRIFNWEVGIVPGLLQTADYARALLSNSPISLDQADYRLVARMRRQSILHSAKPARLVAIIDEAVVHREVGSPDIMSDQIDQLLEVSLLGNVTLRIVPGDVGYHPGLAGAFMLYEFAQLPPIVYLEHHHASSFLHDEAGVGRYRALTKLMQEKALGEDDTRALLREVARDSPGSRQ